MPTLTKQQRLMLLLGLIALVVVLSAWASTYSASYETCQDERYASRHEQPDFGEKIAYFFVCQGVTIGVNGELITAIATVVIAGFTAILWSVSRETAKAAMLQAKALIAIERPVLALIELKFTRPPDPTGDNDGPVVTGTPWPYVRFTLTFENTGRTAAIARRVGFGWSVGVQPPKVMKCGTTYDAHNVVIKQTDGKFVCCFKNDLILLDTKQRDAINADRHLFVWGFLEYADLSSDKIESGPFLRAWSKTGANKFEFVERDGFGEHIARVRY